MHTIIPQQIGESSPDTNVTYCALCNKEFGTVKFKGYMICRHCLEHIRAVQ